MSHIDDTIASIATAQGVGAIGIIRISGEKAFDIAKKIFKGKKDFDIIKPNTINYGKIIDFKNNNIIDEVLVSKLKAPHTFTRENIVEINCHGGTIVLKRVLELALREGARLAEPGEFTKRAFLNGRIDLSQAEAVIDIINSKTVESSKAALDQLEGFLSSEIKKSRKKLIELLAHIEVTVDYPEHDVEEITGQKVYEETIKIKENLTKIIENFDRGRVIREGLKLVIIGRPNVGKSSLLNKLSGQEKAIVTDIPGTTRDIIEEHINISGIPINLIDTAGIRNTEDVVEKIGVDKAKKTIQSADLIIFMVDAVRGLEEEDFAIIKEIEDKKAIILINKIDIADEKNINEIDNKLAGKKIIKTSIKEEIGITELSEYIEDKFSIGEIRANNEILVTNIRHKDLIDKAILSIEEAINAYIAGMTLDLIYIDVKNSAEYLGQITGESIAEDVVNEIFSKFCLGK